MSSFDLASDRVVLVRTNPGSTISRSLQPSRPVFPGQDRVGLGVISWPPRLQGHVGVHHHSAQLSMMHVRESSAIVSETLLPAAKATHDRVQRRPLEDLGSTHQSTAIPHVGLYDIGSRNPGFARLVRATDRSTASTAALRATPAPHRDTPTGLNNMGIQGWPGTCPRHSTQYGITSALALLQGTCSSKCRPHGGFSGFSHGASLVANNLPSRTLDHGDCPVEISST